MESLIVFVAVGTIAVTMVCAKRFARDKVRLDAHNLP